MRLLTKTKGQLLQEAREYLEDNTPLTNFNPGSIIRSILEVMSSEIAEQYEVMNSNLLQAYVTTATGDALDNIGALFGLTRKSARRAQETSSTNVYFYIDTSTGFTAAQLALLQNTENSDNGITSNYVSATSFTIPQGTILRSGNIEYSTTEDAVFTGSATEVGVPVIAAGTGQDYNIPAYTLKNIRLTSNEFSVIRLYLKVENRQSISNGSFIEDDPSYRFRITNAHQAAAKGNESAIRLAALSVPGVNDVILQEYSAGIGTFSVFVIADSPIPSNGLLSAVQEAVNFDKSFGINAIVERPTYRGFEGTFKLVFTETTTEAEKQTIKEQVRILIELYINNIRIGGEFIANELIERIMGFSSKIKDLSVVKFGSGLFDSDTYENKKFRSLFFMNHKVDVDEQPLAVPTRIIVC